MLFTDLVGSTELFSRVGEEDAEKLRGRHFSLLRGAVGGHGGREVKGLGDGLLAVFESASDALACAVGMQRAIADECNRRGAEPMAIRIGLSSGDVAVEGGDCFGEAVTEASRLCAAAGSGQILAADLLRALLRGRGRYAFHSIGALELKGLPAPVEACEVAWEPASGRTIRVVLADDAVLVREGVARLLEENGFSVVAQAGDGEELLSCVASARPDVAITDVRMPPTNTLEGLEAAEQIRSEHPGVAVLVLSQHLESRYARRLMATGRGSVGYLLKERVGDVEEFAELVRRVAAGETVMDPEIAGSLEERDRARLAARQVPRR